MLNLPLLTIVDSHTDERKNNDLSDRKKQFACCSNKKLVGTTKNSQKYIGEEEDGDEAASGDE